MDETLVEAEIAYSVLQSATLDIESAVSRHSGEDLLVRVNFADVPQACDQDSPLSALDHLWNRFG